MRCGSEGDVVDEAHLVDPGGDRHHAMAGLHFADGLQGVIVDDGDVDNPDAPVLAENVRCLGDQAVGAADAGVRHLLCLAERLDESEGIAPLVGRERVIAYAKGQSIRFTNSRDNGHLHFESQVVRHLADDGGALGGLLAEEHDIRTNNVEQFRHERRHAAKMIGPRDAAQRLAQGLLGDKG